MPPKSKRERGGCDDVVTPPELLQQLERMYGSFDFDPCPLNYQVDTLSTDVRWGKRNFVSAPFTKLPLFLKRALFELTEHQATSVMLMPARTNSKYFVELVLPYAADIQFIARRIKFAGFKNAAATPLMVVVFAPREQLECRHNIELLDLGPEYSAWTVANLSN